MSQEAGTLEQVGLGYLFKNTLLLVPPSEFGGFLGVPLYNLIVDI